MELIAQINGAVNSFVWGAPMLILLIGVGILMTVRNKGLQFRKFGYAMKNTIGKIFKRTHAGEGEITPFQAVSTALAGTVGTGNIAGITTAVTLGGPGTLFWLWVTALIGMATKYSEVLLAVKFRERNKYGDWVGGPMYYIKNGLGKNWKWLGIIFCVFAALAALGTGNAIQAGNIVGSIHTAVLAFNPDFSGEATLNLVLGIVLAILAAVVLFGGVKRLGAVTGEAGALYGGGLYFSVPGDHSLQCLQPAHSISRHFCGGFYTQWCDRRCCGLHVPGHQLGDETGDFLQ